jgi:hypothetical protein
MEGKSRNNRKFVKTLSGGYGNSLTHSAALRHAFAEWKKVLRHTQHVNLGKDLGTYSMYPKPLSRSSILRVSSSLRVTASVCPLTSMV